MQNRDTQVLCILDGWGASKDKAYNPILSTPTPHWDKLVEMGNYTELAASGSAVGLPERQMGNSEVGHLTIGSGRVVDQDLVRINKSITNDTLKTQPNFKEFVGNLLKKGGKAHVMGLFSDGGVHSHSDHMIHVIKCLQDANIEVCLHIFLDGRDTPPTHAKDHLNKLMKVHPSLFNNLMIATVSGRFYAMDRDERWDRTQAAYFAIAKGDTASDQTQNRYTEPSDYINAQYKKGTTDEFIPPAVHNKYGGVHFNDGIFMCNFRADRMRQIVGALALPEGAFTKFNRFINNTHTFLIAGMAPYSPRLDPYLLTVFPRLELKNTLGEILAKAQKSQFRLAESEKYAHVTYFFNGGEEHPFKHEERHIIPSPQVATYDLAPEMSADALTTELENAIKTKAFDLIVVNFANPDMVGHTGNTEATSKAIAYVDLCLGRIDAAMQNHAGNLLITADHGNAEKMFDPLTQQPHTAHTTALVPFVQIAYGNNTQTNQDLRKNGTLADIAPTILDLMSLKIPDEMTGTSLFKHDD